MFEDKGCGHRRIWRLAAVAVFLMLPLRGQDSAESDYERGVALFRQGDLRAAAERLRKAVQADPSALNWKALGVVMAAAGDYTAAEPAFREACRVDPDEPDACYFYARALYALDRYNDSLEALVKLIKTDGQPWRIHLGIAQAREAIGEPEDSERQFRKAIRLAQTPPADLHPRLHYGVFLFRQGRTREALKQYRKAAAEIPESGSLQYEMGRALLQIGETEAALRRLERAVELTPQDATARRLLAKVYFRLGRAEDGRRQLDLAGQGSSTSR